MQIDEENRYEAQRIKLWLTEAFSITRSSQCRSRISRDLHSFDTTLVEAAAIAGGFSDASKHSQVVLFRHVSKDKDNVEANVYNVEQMLGSRNLQEGSHLLPAVISPFR